MLCSIPWHQGLKIKPCPRDFHLQGRQDLAEAWPCLEPAPAASSAAVAVADQSRLDLILDGFGEQKGGWHLLPSGKAKNLWQPSIFPRHLTPRSLFQGTDGLDKPLLQLLKPHSPLDAIPFPAGWWREMALRRYHLVARAAGGWYLIGGE